MGSKAHYGCCIFPRHFLCTLADALFLPAPEFSSTVVESLYIFVRGDSGREDMCDIMYNVLAVARVRDFMAQKG